MKKKKKKELKTHGIEIRMEITITKRLLRTAEIRNFMHHWQHSAG